MRRFGKKSDGIVNKKNNSRDNHKYNCITIALAKLLQAKVMDEISIENVTVLKTLGEETSYSSPSLSG